MPLRPIEFVSRGGNQLLQGLLNGATVSLSRALSDGVQLTRDAASNQLTQENAFLGERRFDRTFREGQFRDRRNFDRRVFTEDRSFGENVRQFNVTAEDRDQDRALRAELGRGNLGIARERLGLERQRTDQALRLGDLQFDRAEFLFDQEQGDRAALDNLRERERIANDPVLFANEIQGTDDPSRQGRFTNDELEELRAQELERVARDYEFFERPRSAEFNLGESVRVGVLPPRTQRDQKAEQTLIEAETFIENGDFVTAIEQLGRAQAEALPGSPTHAQIVERRRVVEAQRAAFAEGSGISREAAEKAVEEYTKYRATAFFGSSSFEEEVRAVLAANTREEYVNAVEGERGERPSTTDTRAKRRAEFYDSIKESSPRDRQQAQASGDPYAGILTDLDAED